MSGWPDGEVLARWSGLWPVSVDAQVDVWEIMATATEAIRLTIDVRKLPLDGVCPPTIRQAILLEGARLLARRDSAHGVVAFGDLAFRLATADVDIEKLLIPWRLDPEP